MPNRFAQNKVLGLAIGEQSLVVAEASRAGESPRITLAAAFDYPAGLSLDDPARLGEALAAFLKERGFTARHATVGLPARWVLSKSKELPPAEASVAAEALRLQVEGEFTSELKDLYFDYAGTPSVSETRNVLLVAVQGRRIESIKALLAAAGLKPAAITPLGVVLGAASAGSGNRSTLVVTVGPAGVELAAQDGATPRALRHLGSASASAGLLAGELRRAAMAVALPAANGNAHAHANGNGANGTNGHGPALVLWDGSSFTETARRVLADAAGAKLHAGDLGSLGVPDGLTAGGRDLGGAAALAVATLDDSRLAVDFLDSKLAEPKAPLVARRTLVMAGIGVAAFLLVFIPWLDLKLKESRLADLDAENRANVDKVKAANAFSERVRYAAEWKSPSPDFYLCLLELQRSIPEDLQTYVLTVNINQDMSGSLMGRSARESAATGVAGALKDNPRFKFVRLQQLDPRANNNSSEVGFRIDFQFAPTRRSAAAPAAATRPSR